MDVPAPVIAALHGNRPKILPTGGVFPHPHFVFFARTPRLPRLLEFVFQALRLKLFKGFLLACQCIGNGRGRGFCDDRRLDR
jgi:hypothetical protein